MMVVLVRAMAMFAILWAMLALPGPALAAPYPGYSDLYLNDLAHVLTEDDAAALRDDLIKLRTDAGVEMTVLTIPSRSAYDSSSSLEVFATGLFNHWGVGQASRNDGILVLVVTDDREMRVELGKGYDQGYDVIAQDIVTRWFLPELRNGNYGAAIRAGSGQIIDRIARRHAEGLPAELPSASSRSLIDRLMPWLIGAVFAGVIGTSVFGRRIGDWSYRFRRCPTCGQRGLHRSHVGPVDPTLSPTGRILTECRRCNWRDERPWNRTVSSRPGRGGGGSFGGGRSSGGGASGRW